MANTKFDFDKAKLLVELLKSSSNAFEIINDKIIDDFKHLYEYFSDSGYETYSGAIASIMNQSKQIVESISETTIKIDEYAIRLQEGTTIHRR